MATVTPVLRLSKPRYLEFDRAQWAQLRANTPLTLTTDDVEKLGGINVHLDIDMVEHTYLPLSRLLNLEVQGSRQLASVTDTFLGTPPRPVPFIVGVAGSVAVGKSTISRVMQALLGSLATASPSRSCHYRWIPASQCRARETRSYGSQGVSGEL